MRVRLIAAGIAVLAALGPTGCALMAPRVVADNPLLVPSSDFETVWKTTITVIDEYFDIATENRLSGKIVTQPKMAAMLGEPWNGDSVGFRERLESNLQTIRRFAQVTVKPPGLGTRRLQQRVPGQPRPRGRRPRPHPPPVDPPRARPEARAGHPGADPRLVVPLIPCRPKTCSP